MNAIGAVAAMGLFALLLLAGVLLIIRALKHPSAASGEPPRFPLFRKKIAEDETVMAQHRMDRIGGKHSSTNKEQEQQ